MDFRGLTAETVGGSLRLTFDMAAVSQVWNPQNGFDHLALSVFIDVPEERGGQRDMPMQNAQLPGDMRWDYRLRLHGWSNALFLADGASATSDGRPAQRAADIAVDPQRKTITLTIPAGALGGRTSLRGATVFATSWDYDGGYRPLASQAGPFVFGGAPSNASPKIMDAVGPLRLQ
jgi:hypothetical protein